MTWWKTKMRDGLRGENKKQNKQINNKTTV